MQTKTCSRCSTLRPLTDFPLRSGKVDGARRRGVCKYCKNADGRLLYVSRRRSEARIMKDRARTRAAKKRWRDENRQIVLAHYAANPCKCGETNPVLLEFDHTGDKKFNISQVTRVSPRRLLEEIKKCEVRCVKCHRMKTAKEQDWFTYRWWIEQQGPRSCDQRDSRR